MPPQLSFRAGAYTGVGISGVGLEIATPVCGLVRNDMSFGALRFCFRVFRCGVK